MNKRINIPLFLVKKANYMMGNYKITDLINFRQQTKEAVKKKAKIKNDNINVKGTTTE